MVMVRRAVILSVFCAVGLLTRVSAAHASPLPGSLQLRLIDSLSGSTVTITDQGACAGTCVGWTADINATLGVVTATGPLGAWVVNVTTGIGYPFDPTQGVLDLNSINATSTPGGGSLQILVTQFGFDVDYPGFELAAGGTLAGSGPGATVAYSALGGNNNIPFSASNTLASLGPFGSAAFSGTA